MADVSDLITPDGIDAFEAAMTGLKNESESHATGGGPLGEPVTGSAKSWASAAAAHADRAEVVVDALVDGTAAPTVLRAGTAALTRVPSVVTLYNTADAVHGNDRVGFGMKLGVKGAGGDGRPWNELTTSWRVTAGTLTGCIVYILDDTANATTFEAWKALPKLLEQAFDLPHNTREFAVPFPLERVIMEHTAEAPVALGWHIVFLGTGGLQVRPVVQTAGGPGMFYQSTGSALDASATGNVHANSVEYALGLHTAGDVLVGATARAPVEVRAPLARALDRFGGGIRSLAHRQSRATRALVNTADVVEGSVVEPIPLDTATVAPDAYYSVTSELDLGAQAQSNQFWFGVEADETYGDVYEFEVVVYAGLRTLSVGVPVPGEDVARHGRILARETVYYHVPVGTGVHTIPVPIWLKRPGEFHDKVVVVVSADKRCLWLGRALPGATSYVRRQTEATADGFVNLIGHPNPLGQLWNAPITDTAMYMRAEFVVPTFPTFRDGTGLRPGGVSVPKAHSAACRFPAKTRRVVKQAQTTWRTGYSDAATSYGPIVISVADLGSSLANNNPYSNQRKLLYPGRYNNLLQIAGGAWDENDDHNPAGAVSISYSGFGGGAVLHVFDIDDGGAISPGGRNRLWADGAMAEYTFANPVARFFLRHRRLAGGGTLTVEDVDGGDGTLGTIDLSDAAGEGAALACFEMSLAARTVRVTCSGGSALASRTCGGAADSGGQLPELFFQKFARGSTQSQQWLPILEDGRVFGLWLDESYAGGETGTGTGSAAGHRVPTPDLIRLLMSDGDARSTDEEVLSEIRERFARMAVAIDLYTSQAWSAAEAVEGAYGADQLWLGVADYTDDRGQFGRSRGAGYEGAVRVAGERGVHSSYLSLLDWQTYGSANALDLLGDVIHWNNAGAQVVIEEEFDLALCPGMF